MTHDISHGHDPPLPEPGQRVAVFLDDDASGATLGYYGEFLGVSVESLLNGVHTCYRVFVPFLRSIIDVHSDDVFVCPTESKPQLGPSPRPTPLGAVRFFNPPSDDNSEIKGYFRIGEGSWSHFLFVKTSLSHPRYEFSAPVRGDRIDDGILFYEIPTDIRLDRTFVLAALTEIMGGKVAWQVTEKM